MSVPASSSRRLLPLVLCYLAWRYNFRSNPFTDQNAKTVGDGCQRPSCSLTIAACPPEAPPRAYSGLILTLERAVLVAASFPCRDSCTRSRAPLTIEGPLRGGENILQAVPPAIPACCLGPARRPAFRGGHIAVTGGCVLAHCVLGFIRTPSPQDTTDAAAGPCQFDKSRNRGSPRVCHCFGPRNLVCLWGVKPGNTTRELGEALRLPPGGRYAFCSRAGTQAPESQWYKALSTYERPNHRKAVWQLFNTFGPYIALWALMVYLVRQEYSYWITLAFTAVAAALFIRIFIFFTIAAMGLSSLRHEPTGS